MGDDCNSDPIGKAIDQWLVRDRRVTAAEQVVNYHGYIWKKVLFIILCAVGAFLISGVALTVGPYDISVLESYRVIWDVIVGTVTGADLSALKETSDYRVIWEMRLPRIVTGVLTGFGLAAAGVVMQCILRNPLADPYTTGISSGASFGATLAIGLGISVAGMSGYAVAANAFLFSLIPTAIILFVSKMKGASPTTMVMAGIAVMYIFNAMTTMIKLWVDSDTLANIFVWSVGSIEIGSWDNIGIMFVFVLLASIAMMVMSRRLNVLSAGDESARSIGVDANRMRILALLVVSFITAGIVSFTGLIGFVGLVCPHIARIFVGSDVRYLLPASAFFGSALIMFADIVGRTVTESTLQVGVITAFIGGPLFLWLIIRQKREVW